MEYRILRVIWSNDIDIEDLEDVDPRQYCAIVSDDEFYYSLNRNELKKKLNAILNKSHNKVKKLVNNKGGNPNE